MAMNLKVACRYAATITALELLLLLSGCAGLNNVWELDTSQHYQPSPQKAVLLYGGELRQPWPSDSLHLPFMLEFVEYDVVAGHNVGKCWRNNHASGALWKAEVDVPKFFAFVVDPGYFVLSRFSAPVPGNTDEQAAFYAAPGTVSYVGTYVYNGKAAGFDLRRDLTEGQDAAKQFSGLGGPVVLASTAPVRENNPLLCTP